MMLTNEQKDKLLLITGTNWNLEALIAYVEFQLTEARKQERERLRGALHALVAKIDAIAADPSYKAQCSIAWVHGHRYEGPQWTAELEIARAELGKENGKEK